MEIIHLRDLIMLDPPVLQNQKFATGQHFPVLVQILMYWWKEYGYYTEWEEDKTALDLLTDENNFRR